ncbi:hypothetical protein TorRG33x02_331690 [Trema orientale]|uniref:Uncharacterized protein n=1 Tax=Trema orientale TaxID=63057 RepID=A0A2P5B5R0_TREOI|nr:hypothetical protein TorRG33x02_331690 [Trema orientale]
MTDESATSGSVATISPLNPNCSIKDQEINLSNNTEQGLVDDEKASDDKCCCDDVSQTEFYDKVTYSPNI